MIPSVANVKEQSFKLKDKQNSLNEITSIISNKEFQESLKTLFEKSEKIGPDEAVKFLTAQPVGKDFMTEVNLCLSSEHQSFKSQLELIQGHSRILSVHRISSWFSTHTESYKIAISAIKMVLYKCFPEEKVEREDLPVYNKTITHFLESDSFDCTEFGFPNEKPFFSVGHFKRSRDDFITKTHSIKLESGGFRNKNYKIGIDFHDLHVSHNTHQLLKFAKNPDLITSKIKNDEIMPFARNSILKLSSEELEKRKGWIQRVERTKNFNEFKKLLDTKKGLSSEFDDSPENQQIIAYYILSRNRHWFRFSSHRTKSIENILTEIERKQEVLQKLRQQESAMKLTLDAISNDKKASPSCDYYPHISRPSLSSGVHLFERIDSNRYVIHMENKKSIGKGGSKEAYEGLMVTVNDDGSLQNIRPIVITKQNMEAANQSNANKVIQHILAEQEKKGNEFQHLHLGYHRLGSVRNTIPRVPKKEPRVGQVGRESPSEYTYQHFFEKGTLADNPAQNMDELIQDLIQITTGLKEATECKVCVRDIKPENIFVEVVDNRKKCYLADMDDWLLESELERTTTAAQINFSSFHTILKDFLLKSKIEKNALEKLKKTFFDDDLMNKKKNTIFSLDKALSQLQQLQNT